MATIKDVAALAGISYTTVSHVVNKTRPVSEPVRIKVEAAIKQLDYVPSAVARSLKAKTTATIGLLVPNSLNPYFAELARGIEDYCERNGYCVILCNSDDNAEKQRNYLRVLLEKRIDGLIVTSVGGDDSGLAAGLSAVRTPMVIVDRALDGIDVDLVRIDHEEGAYLATRHLLELAIATLLALAALPIPVSHKCVWRAFTVRCARPVSRWPPTAPRKAISPARAVMPPLCNCWRKTRPVRFLPVTT